MNTDSESAAQRWNNPGNALSFNWMHDALVFNADASQRLVNKDAEHGTKIDLAGANAPPRQYPHARQFRLRFAERGPARGPHLRIAGPADSTFLAGGEEHRKRKDEFPSILPGHGVPQHRDAAPADLIGGKKENA
jgi:hypothetical protein